LYKINKMKEKEKAIELLNTFKTVLKDNSNISTTNTIIKRLSKASCDKILIEVTGNKERYDFYLRVKEEIDLI